MPDISAIEREINWEMHCNEEGTKRYTRSLQRTVARKDGSSSVEWVGLADSRPGSILVAQAVNAIEDGVAVAIDEAKHSIAGATKRTGEWWWFLCMVEDPLKLSLITIRCILTMPVNDISSGRAATPVMLSIGSAVHDEVEYQLWVKQTKSAEKENPPEGRSLLQQLKDYSGGSVDRNTWKRWIRKVETIETTPWSREHKIALGGKLLEIAVTHGSRFFKYETIFRQGRTEYRVFLTEEAQAALSDINARLEVNRPLLMPMVQPPKPWTRIVA